MAKEKGLVSVVVPFFGKFDSTRFDLVKESILNQLGTNVELVVANDLGIHGSLTVPKVLRHSNKT